MQIERLKKIIEVSEKYPFEVGGEKDINFGGEKDIVWIGADVAKITEEDERLLEELGAEINKHYSTIEIFCC